MSDMFLDLMDEIGIEDSAESGQGFRVDNDQKAEWVIGKLRAEQEDLERVNAVCDAEIRRYTDTANAAKERYERRTANLRGMLKEYMATVKARETKTQRSYTLPSAKLIVKRKQPKVERDDKALLSWMKENAPEYITEKVSYSPAWATLKDTLTVSGSEYVTKDGLIVEGVKLVPQDDEFVIQFNGE